MVFSQKEGKSGKNNIKFNRTIFKGYGRISVAPVAVPRNLEFLRIIYRLMYSTGGAIDGMSHSPKHMRRETFSLSRKKEHGIGKCNGFQYVELDQGVQARIYL